MVSSGFIYNPKIPSQLSLIPSEHIEFQGNLTKKIKSPKNLSFYNEYLERLFLIFYGNYRYLVIIME